MALLLSQRYIVEQCGPEDTEMKVKNGIEKMLTRNITRWLMKSDSKKYGL